jgi:hypothetical protein
MGSGKLQNIKSTTKISSVSILTTDYLKIEIKKKITLKALRPIGKGDQELEKT